MSEVASSTILFDSGHELATRTRYFFIATVILAVISIISNYMQIELLSRAIDGGAITEEAANFNDSRQQIIGIIQFLIFIFTVVVFLMWFHRTHRNLPALGVKNLKYTPGWAVGFFFIPIFSLFRPFQVAREIWNASDPDSYDETSWEGLGTAFIVRLWWAMFLIWSIVSNLAGKMMWRSPDTIEGLLEMTWVMLVSDFLEILAALFAIQLVKGIDQRQELKFNRISVNMISSTSMP